MNKDKHYVDNKKLLHELTLHRQGVEQSKADGSKKPQLSSYVGECILLISNKLANRPNFINYPFKEEMISDGIENCLMYIDNFDPAKSSNPFGYITQIIYFAFLRRIKKEKKYLYTKHKLMQASMIYNEQYEQSEWNEQTDQKNYENEHMNDFVRDFEEAEKKVKAAKKNPNKDIDTMSRDEVESLIECAIQGIDVEIDWEAE